MLFSRKLITLFIPDFKRVNDLEFTRAINSLGMEVESIHQYYIPNNCVIGQIKSITDIEGTHLHYCDVEVSPSVTNKIVCGASGLIVGKKVIVAKEGAKLPNGITIAKRNIRGYESNGMMCAYSELTGNKDTVADAELDEIIMLDEGEVGSEDWPKYIGMDDTIYDITVPANRNDENSYLILCYELAGKLGLWFNYDLKSLLKSLPAKSNDIEVNKNVCSFLSFTDFEVTPKYIGRSKWDNKAILMNHGIKPINYLLDKLALITLLTNCPTHVYDAEKLAGEMRCDIAKADTKFVGLNNKAYSLTENDILIYDQNHPVSIACVIGSDETKLTDKTKIARIEVGNFQFANVRQTALRLNTETDAARKASKPISNYMNLVTLDLIKKNLGKPIKESLTFNPNWYKYAIELDWDVLKWFINEPLDKNFVIEALKKQGYDNSILSRNSFKPAPWRLEVSNQADLFEDILKILDINKLQPISISDNLLPFADNTEYNLKQELKELLVTNGLCEVKTYNLTNKSNLDKFNFFKLNNPVKILCNNSNREYFRLSLIDNMLKAYQYNNARKLDLLPIFEIQNIFTNDLKQKTLSIITTDKMVIDNITNSFIAINLNSYKAMFDWAAKDVFNTSLEYKLESNEYCYNNESAVIYHENQPIGYMGKIKQSLLKDYDLDKHNIYCLTLNLEPLFKQYKPLKFKIKPFGIYQRLSKDINIELEPTTSHLISDKLAKINSLDDIESSKVINVFYKDNKVIYTVRYYLVDTKQFTTADIDNINKQLLQLLA